LSANVGASLTSSDLALVNQTTGQTISTANIALSYNSSTNTATFTFPVYSGGMLPVGNYQATILAGNVADAGGVPLAANFNLTILQLVGDLNLDGHFDGRDIAPMQTALTNPAGYMSAHNLSAAQLVLLADIDHDTLVTNADLQKLLSTLISGGGSSENLDSGN